ncbi:Alanyl-tRNA synthetase (AlaS) (PDB:2ZZE) [Commensalibacter communis]|uniref:alanine--tRNA ligase n=1 Tax=Commensalibacter communis TaxID=2972786 RepID=UPI0022FFBA07|nr:alanine--tRNA ligase [Commensalibacter communis]CAI3926890.1 Alanyl-tRNA synthetase (AlaS) (PDB:2ZZE) [Commensalibacter communis]
MPSTNEIRSTFIDYFTKNNHQHVPSSPLVPQNDPTLLFTNAGMVQFKNVFTGQEQRSYSRATTAQKVVRAGGKHNDLDNVGYTARHHTFFEMMGNFSFGDYFKEGAIEFAWNLITKEFGLSKDKLLATVYADDEEAAELWKKIAGFSDDRIIRINSSDNFWRMGDTGPCGPCSEIFYDHGQDVFGGPPGSPDEDGDRFVEIWNLVFMQYFEDPPGTRTPLPRPSIDTGMGLERFAAIMQGKRDNFDIDTFQSLIRASAEVTNTDPFGTHKVSHRVVADHLRSAAFLIADGVLPSKDGRGYVLRRIMRRAMRHLHMIGTKEPTFFKLLPALITEMGGAYPELIQAKALISETLKGEEERFKTMLDRGLSLLADETNKLPSKGKLPGDVAFKLYDTYGFPLDLTADALREKGFTVDQEGFDSAMNEQRSRARAAWVGSGDNATETVWFEFKEKCGATEFLGYKNETADAEIQAIIVNNQSVQEAKEGDEVAILLNQTPFYGESGGQAGDTGYITSKNAIVTIINTQKKLGDLIVHYGKITKGSIKVGEPAAAALDHKERQAIKAHHSATHLLHQALRNQLGDHVTQKGSLNSVDRLRFDFSHSKPLTPEELQSIESAVNEEIRKNEPVVTRIMTPDEAVKLGAMALFGEKYGDEVRVVAMGNDKEKLKAWSIELCGGTHVTRTAEIGLFHIISETGVAAGIRRIEAVAGTAAEAYFKQNEATLHETASLLNTPSTQLVERLQQLLEERKSLKQQVSKLQHQIAVGGNEQNNAEKIGNIEYAMRNLGDVAPKELKSLAEGLVRKMDNGIAVVFSSFGDKASFVVAVSKDLSQTVNAVHLVQIASDAVGGKGGGGRPDMAQAGGPNACDYQIAFDRILKEIKKLSV